MNTLDPQAQQLLDAAANSGLAPVYRVGIHEARERMRAGFISPDPLVGVRVDDLIIPEAKVPLRVFRAEEGGTAAGLFFFHGGGWTVNDLDTHAYLCGELAKLSGACVISVGFDSAPEYKYPHALRQCTAAVDWCCNNSHLLGFDSQRIGLMGDSSGGALALAVASEVGSRRPISALALAYPVTDYINYDLESYKTRGTGYSLNNEFMEWSWKNYLPEEYSEDDGQLFPLRSKSLGNMPPTIIATAEFDPLMSEGLLLGDKMKKEGVEVKRLHGTGQMHGFLLQTRRIDAARAILTEIATELRSRL